MTLKSLRFLFLRMIICEYIVIRSITRGSIEIILFKYFDAHCGAFFSEMARKVVVHSSNIQHTIHVNNMINILHSGTVLKLICYF